MIKPPTGYVKGYPKGRIITVYDPPPIPGGYDMAWRAWRDGDEESSECGYGRTEQAAIQAYEEEYGDD